MIVSIIAAIGEKNKIGFEGKLPWKIQDDFANFKKLTLGHKVIMGRKTYESIGHALPGRENIVITTQPNFSAPGCRVVHNLDSALKLAQGSDKEIFVIGGGRIYTWALPLAQKMYLSHVEADVQADAFFPEFDPTEWKVISSKHFPKNDRNEFPFTYKVYERIKPAKKTAVFIDPRYAKSDHYRQAMAEIQTANVCPLCPETMRWHTKPILKRQGSWFITETFQPYANAQYHFIIVSSVHKEQFEELTTEDWHDVSALVRWATKEFNLKGGGITLRFGDSTYTGATVFHLHFHLIVPQVEGGQSKPVYFPIG